MSGASPELSGAHAATEVVTTLPTLPEDVLQSVGAALSLSSLTSLGRSSQRLRAALLQPSSSLLGAKRQQATEVLLSRLTTCWSGAGDTSKASKSDETTATHLDCAFLRLTITECGLLAHFIAQEGAPCLESMRVSHLQLPVQKLLRGRGAAVERLNYDMQRLAAEDVAVLSVLLEAGGGAALSTLGLQHTSFGDRTIALFAQPLCAAAMPNLSMLWLSHNEISDVAVAVLARALAAGTPQLRHLTLSDNRLTSTGANALAEHFGRGLRGLHELSLSGNAITDLDGFVGAFEGGGALKWLELQNNRIDDRGARALSRALGSLTALTVLGARRHQSQDLEARPYCQTSMEPVRLAAYCRTDTASRAPSRPPPRAHGRM